MKKLSLVGIAGLFALIGCNQKSAISDDNIRNVSQALDIGGLMRPNDGAGINGSDDNGIQYHGGGMLGLSPSSVPTIYYIWYGNWAGSPAIPILTDFANSIGGSPYFNVNSSYCNAADCSVTGLPVINQVAYGSSAFDNYSQGTSIDDLGVQSIVAGAIGSGQLPRDSNGIYFVLTSADVNETSGMCNRYCGWHSHGFISSQDVKFSYVGSPDRCITRCAPQSSSSPNDNPAADGMANIVGHELEESVTDPDLSAWFDSGGNENADKCAWTFGTQYPAANGSRANMRLGSRDFLIQQNWVNDFGGYCGLSYAGRIGPRVGDFTPQHGYPGDSLTVNGANFVNVSSVTVAGVSCSFSVVTDHQLVATLPSDAAPGVGPLTVVTSDGTAISASNYTIYGPAPIISFFAPSSGLPGDSISIVGTNFSGTSAVKIAGRNAASYAVVSSTQITAVVPGGGGISGPVTLTTATGGSSDSTASFTLLGAFTTAAAPVTGHAFHTATLLTGGQVLVVGGYDGTSPNGAAEVYDPGSSAFSGTGGLNVARGFHSATALQDGRVLVVGGGDGTSSIATAEIYDPSSGQFTLSAGTLSAPRRGHTATLLANGQVLIAGGLSDATSSLATAELYDPASNSFISTGGMQLARSWHTATALNDGRVLVIGGPGTGANTAGTTGELYDPTHGTFSLAGGFAARRIYHTAVLLTDGRVIIGGGEGFGSSVLFYDPATGFSTSNGPVSGGARSAAVLLPLGRVLWTGGTGGTTGSRLYNPNAGTFFVSGTLTVGRSSHSATALDDGTVLLVGGVGAAIGTAELYSDASP